MSSSSSAAFETPARQVFRLRRGGPGILAKRPRPSTAADTEEELAVNPAVEPGVRAKRCRAMLRKNTERLHELCNRMYQTMLEAQKLKDESHACADFARLLALSNESHQLTHFDWGELKAHHTDLEQIFEVVMLPQWVVLWPQNEPYSPVKAPIPLTRQTAGVIPESPQPQRQQQPDDSDDVTTDDGGETGAAFEARQLTRSSSPSY